MDIEQCPVVIVIRCIRIDLDPIISRRHVIFSIGIVKSVITIMIRSNWIVGVTRSDWNQEIGGIHLIISGSDDHHCPGGVTGNCSWVAGDAELRTGAGLPDGHTGEGCGSIDDAQSWT